MKQVYIGKEKEYASGVDYKDITLVPEGTFALFNLYDGSLITCKDDIKGNFAIVLGRGQNKMPLHFPEVDVKSLTVEKAEYQEGSTFKATITIPTTEKGKTYTVVIAKKGVVFNERNRWSYSTYAKSDVAADVASDIVNQINANASNSGVKAEASGGAITITATSVGPNYAVFGADELMGVEPTDVTDGTPEMLGKEYVQDLASRCAAGKGFNYLGDDGAEIYPGYPETVEDTEYAMYTLRFAVPRVASKQRDEVVYQLVHVVLPKDSEAITTLDDILDTWNITGYSFCNGGCNTEGLSVQVPEAEKQFNENALNGLKLKL